MVRWVLCSLVLTSCVQEGIDAQVELPLADGHFFRCKVQPVLARDCAFMDCHGNDERPFRVYAEQRFRLEVDWFEPDIRLSDAELAANFRVARGFIDQDDDLGYLSEKPLQRAAGGLFHRAQDLYGTQDVYLSEEEAGYQVLRSFSTGVSAASDCQPEVAP